MRRGASHVFDGLAQPAGSIGGVVSGARLAFGLLVVPVAPLAAAPACILLKHEEPLLGRPGSQVGYRTVEALLAKLGADQLWTGRVGTGAEGRHGCGGCERGGCELARRV